MTPSIWQLLIILVVVLILFGGGGKIPRLMGDLAKGIKSFKTNIKEEEASELAASGKPRVETDEGSATVAAREDETAKS